MAKMRIQAQHKLKPDDVQRRISERLIGFEIGKDEVVVTLHTPALPPVAEASIRLMLEKQLRDVLK